MQPMRDRLFLEGAAALVAIAAITSAEWEATWRTRTSAGAGSELTCLTAAFIRRDFDIDWNPRPG
jgi:hypothetical protein